MLCQPKKFGRQYLELNMHRPKFGFFNLDTPDLDPTVQIEFQGYIIVPTKKLVEVL